MKVRILGHNGMKEWDGDKQVLEFSSTCGATGILVDIERLVLRAHQSKLYHVKLDAPNWGTWKVVGTHYLEEVKE